MRLPGRLALVAATTATLMCVAGDVRATDRPFVEAAYAGRPYDYIVHVRNTYDYVYNPLVRDDRIREARRVIRSYCPRSQVIGEDSINTEILGITSSRPDYVVYVRCDAPAGRRSSD